MPLGLSVLKITRKEQLPKWTVYLNIKAEASYLGLRNHHTDGCGSMNAAALVSSSELYYTITSGEAGKYNRLWS